MYFIQMRHSWSHYMLGVFFGVSHHTISNYIDQVALKMQEKFVPRLFFLPTPQEVRPYIPPEVTKFFQTHF